MTRVDRHAAPARCAAPAAGVPRSGRFRSRRASRLRQLLGDNERRLADAFRDGADIDALLPRARAHRSNASSCTCFAPASANARALALFAVGGFGRGELFPHSDVDLLALCDKPLSRVVAPRARSVLHLPVGYRPQTRPCRARHSPNAASSPRATRQSYTNLLDARRLAGDALHRCAPGRRWSTTRRSGRPRTISPPNAPSSRSLRALQRHRLQPRAEPQGRARRPARACI